MTKKEVRSYSGALTPRLTGRTISGYAIVFNQRSLELIDNNGRRFVEIIRPNSVTRATILRSDVQMLVEHTGSRLLARSKEGSGTLNIEIDAKGVKYRFESPQTADGDFVVEMVRLGNITGSSFGFNVTKNGDKWTKQSNGIWLREVTEIWKLYDFSIVSSPAYTGTSVQVRNQQISQSDEKRRLDVERAEFILNARKKAGI